MDHPAYPQDQYPFLCGESLSPLPILKEIPADDQENYLPPTYLTTSKYPDYPLLMASSQDGSNYAYNDVPVEPLTYPQPSSQWYQTSYSSTPLTVNTTSDWSQYYFPSDQGNIAIDFSPDSATLSAFPHSATSMGFTTVHLSPSSPWGGSSVPSLSPANSGLSLTPSPNNISDLLPPIDPTPVGTPSSIESETQITHTGYSHREAAKLFRDVYHFNAGPYGPFVPQDIYKPHTTSDRKRYVEDINLEAPIYFQLQSMVESGVYGIPLSDALHSRTRELVDSGLPVFQGRGPSVSIRLEWPGYRRWSRQIPTKDFRSPPQPITVAKLAKNVAKCVKRFLETPGACIDEDADARWKVGPGAIQLEDLILVSIHHTSLGSWQPHLRLRQRSTAVRPTPAMLQAAHARAHMKMSPKHDMIIGRPIA